VDQKGGKFQNLRKMIGVPSGQWHPEMRLKTGETLNAQAKKVRLRQLHPPKTKRDEEGTKGGIQNKKNRVGRAKWTGWDNERGGGVPLLTEPKRRNPQGGWGKKREQTHRRRREETITHVGLVRGLKKSNGH